MADADHHPNTPYTDGDGFHLNDGKVLNDAGADIAGSLEVLNSTTTSELGFIDGAVEGTLTASKAVVVNSSSQIDTFETTGVLTVGGKIALKLSGGAASSSGLLAGVGTTASPAASSTADDKFIELRCKTTATSGDNRLMYLRYQMNGINATGGECIRAFTKLDAACGTVRGAHISLDIDDSPAGSVTGLAVGVDAQLLIGNAALPANGTYYAAQSQIYSAGSSSSVAAVTEHAIHSFSSAGDGTGADTVLNCFAISGNTDGTTKMIYSHDHAAGNAAGSVRVLINGVPKFMKFWAAE